MDVPSVAVTPGARNEMKAIKIRFEELPFNLERQNCETMVARSFKAYHL